MLRLFIAIDLPSIVKDQLGDLCSGLGGAKWVKREQMHLTLRFIGEVDDRQCEAIKAALSTIHSPLFSMRLEGIGQFPERGKPHVLWVGVKAPNSLNQLQQQIENTLLKLELAPADKPFSPHITLARFKMPPAPESMREYFVRHTDFGTEAIAVESFILYSSLLTTEGPIYRQESVYSLQAE